jgi:hypothetical protein
MKAIDIVKDFATDLYDLHFNEMLFICIRGVIIRDGKFVFNENKTDEWNDTVWVFDKGWDQPYDGTVDAGLFWIQNPMGKEGAVHILPGLTTLRRGNHRGREAFVQTGDVLVYRDTTKKGTWEHRDMTGGSSRGINLHAAHDLKNVGRDSAGCSVPKLLWGSVEWNRDFIRRADRSTQNRFYRLYINPGELALYIGEKYNGSGDKDFAHVLYENRQRRT